MDGFEYDKRMSADGGGRRRSEEDGRDYRLPSTPEIQWLPDQKDHRTGARQVAEYRGGKNGRQQKGDCSEGVSGLVLCVLPNLRVNLPGRLHRWQWHESDGYQGVVFR